MDYKKKSFTVVSKGKGAQRKFADNWDLTFNSCKDHPRYKLNRAPRSKCAICWELWNRRRK